MYVGYRRGLHALTLCLRARLLPVPIYASRSTARAIVRIVNNAVNDGGAFSFTCFLSFVFYLRHADYLKAFRPIRNRPRRLRRHYLPPTIALQKDVSEVVNSRGVLAADDARLCLLAACDGGVAINAYFQLDYVVCLILLLTRAKHVQLFASWLL